MDIRIHHGHLFDIASLEKWCQGSIPNFGVLREINQISGGVSNPTFFLNTVEGSTQHEFVLRKQPPGSLLPSAHQVDREYRVMAALGATDVPVPRMRALCVNTNIIGTKFYLMERLHGRVLSEVSLPGVGRADRIAIYAQLAEVLAKLHRVDIEACGLSDFGRPGNFFERQIQRWIKQYRGSQTEEIPAMNQLIQYLPANIPDEAITTIVHGDYRLGNVMFHADQPRMIAVLDWELSTLGHPFADVAYSSLMWEFDRGTFGFLKGIDIDALGIPRQTEFVSAYLRYAGRRSLNNWNYYLGFAMFRLAAIWQGVYKRMLDGNAASAAPIENNCPRMARQALEIIERGPFEIIA
jgi:aminoglycoside phosphotransferase (APT) family kinase protein